MFKSACALLLVKHEKTMTSEKKFALTISHLNFELKSHEKKFVTKGCKKVKSPQWGIKPGDLKVIVHYSNVCVASTIIEAGSKICLIKACTR